MNTQILKEGTLLQGGKYRIEKVLGQGGFGIIDAMYPDGLFFFAESCTQRTGQVIRPDNSGLDFVFLHAVEAILRQAAKQPSQSQKITFGISTLNEVELIA